MFSKTPGGVGEAQLLPPLHHGFTSKYFLPTIAAMGESLGSQKTFLNLKLGPLKCVASYCENRFEPSGDVDV